MLHEKEDNPFSLSFALVSLILEALDDEQNPNVEPYLTVPRDQGDADLLVLPFVHFINIPLLVVWLPASAYFSRWVISRNKYV